MNGRKRDPSPYTEAQEFAELWNSLTPEQQEQIYRKAKHPLIHPFTWLFKPVPGKTEPPSLPGRLATSST